MKPWVFRLGIGGLLVAAAAVGWSQADLLKKTVQAPTSPETAANIKVRPQPARVGALGRLEPSSEVLDIDAATGDRIQQLYVTERQIVEKDQPLAQLESHDTVLAEKEEIAAQLEESRKLLRTTQEHGRACVRVAEVALETVEKLEPLRIDAQRARVRAMEAEFQTAESEFRRAERLVDSEIVTREDYERKRLEYQRQSELVVSARLALAELEASYKLSRNAKAAELAQARANLEQALAAIPVQSLEQKLSLAEARLQRTIIRAPIAGQVLKVFTWAGEKVGLEPILKLGETSRMHAVAEVYETDVQWVQLGQAATISSPALPHRLTGKVVQIGTMIHKNDVLNVDPAADADARVVEVRIELDEPAAAQSMTYLQVDVLIDLAPTRDASAVSSEAPVLSKATTPLAPAAP